MGDKYLRIANRNPASARGFFPRRLLRVIGASTKRADGAGQIGQFGTGKKLAPAAALRMGMEVHIASHDAEGPYFYSYGVLTAPGTTDRQIVMRGHGCEDVVLDIDPAAAKNWDEPVGDDHVRCLHVLREYLNDAKDADPEGPRLQPDCTVLAPAVGGTTSVYLTMTEEIRHVLANPGRYFKFLSGAKPAFHAGGIGSLCLKSESGATRLFARGSLAFCSKKEADSSAFDYDFVEKELLSEERTFRSMPQVLIRLMRLLANLSDLSLAKALLAAMLDGKARLELSALEHLGEHAMVPQAAVWKRAWDELHAGKDAVMSSYVHYYDEYARAACGKHVVQVNQPAARKLLRLCGVPFASAFYPDHKKNAAVIVPKPEQKANLDTALRMLSRWGLAHPDFPTHVYRPLVQGKDDNPALGFCLPEGDGKGTYILERMTDDLRDALETAYHEHAHARSGAIDGTREFDDRKDEDVGRLLLIAERLLRMLADRGAPESEILGEVEDLVREEEEDEEEKDASAADITDAEIDALFCDAFENDPTDPLMSEETRKALALIRKMEASGGTRKE